MLGRCSLLMVLLAWPALARADAPNPSFYLVNRSDQAIQSFFASPVNARTWGADQLGDDTLDPGANAPVRLPADGTCNFDLRVVYDNGRTEERRNVNTCRQDDISFNGQASRPGTGRPEAASADPDHDPSFRLVNRGQQDIAELYVRPAGSGNWGDDRLGDDVLSADDDTVIRIAPGQCLYDVRVIFENRRATERRRVNLCELNDLTFP